MYTHTRGPTLTHVQHKYMYTHTRTHTLVHIHTQMYTHTHTHTHTQGTVLTQLQKMWPMPSKTWTFHLMTLPLTLGWSLPPPSPLSPSSPSLVTPHTSTLHHPHPSQDHAHHYRCRKKMMKKNMTLFLHFFHPFQPRKKMIKVNTHKAHLLLYYIAVT